MNVRFVFVSVSALSVSVDMIEWCVYKVVFFLKRCVNTQNVFLASSSA